MSNSAQAQNAEAEAASTYVEPESLFAQCTAAIGTRANVRLLRWDFLDDRARRLALATTDAERAALALPRRQDLERDHPAAFYSLDELQALPRGNKAFAGGPLPLVAVSYCWRSAAHPDPFGQALVRRRRAARAASPCAAAQRSSSQGRGRLLRLVLARPKRCARQPDRPRARILPRRACVHAAMVCPSAHHRLHDDRPRDRPRVRHAR